MNVSGEWGPRFEEIFGKIVGWRARAEQNPPEPDPHSSLAADDTVFPQMPASQIAYNGLAVAVEYLDFFRTSLTGAGTLHPTAHYTILRSALVGATQAVWVLAGPRLLRQQRALHSSLFRTWSRISIVERVRPPTTAFLDQRQLLVVGRLKWTTRSGSTTPVAMSTPGFSGGFRLIDAETLGQVSVRAVRIKLIDALVRWPPGFS